MNMHKIILTIACLQSVIAFSTSAFDVRRTCSPALLYSMMDLSEKDRHVKAAFFATGSFDSRHIASAITISGKPYFTLSEQGSSTSLIVDGDMSPKWFGLTTTNQDYKSVVELNPQIRSYGMLLHFYKKSEHYFVNIQSALLECRTHLKILETILSGTFTSDRAVTTFQSAMNQSDWKYGKMGSEQKKIGLENIQLQLGMFLGDVAHSNCVLAVSTFVEIPTGKGTKAEWAFEPRVGSNHFGVGFGFDDYFKNETNQFVFGANYRYFFAATEKRSFDLKNNPWSRYMSVISIPTAVGTLGAVSAGINALTLDAKVHPGHQLNSYMRWSKKWESVAFELGYNFFLKSKEKISDTANFASEFGVCNLADSNGSTGNGMKINTNLTLPDTFIQNKMAQDIGVAIVKEDLDLKSAAVGTQAVSSVAARLEYCKDSMRLGIGGSVEAAHSKAAYAAWNCWMNVAVLF